jgi:hypothetical protein
MHRFWKGELHYFDGMKQTFCKFYEAVRDESESPISYDEMIRVTGIMDRIFDECRRGDAELAEKKRERRGRQTEVREESMAESEIGSGR